MHLNYSVTNENLNAVVEGMAISSNDSVLSIAGSGDQVFAMLEKGARVTALDTNPSQIKYLLERKKFLENGDYESFFPSKLLGACDGKNGNRFDFDFAKFLANRRREYFHIDRLDKIKNNLSNLSVLENEEDIYLFLEKFPSIFNKIYLSNSLYPRSISLINLVDALPPNTLIYASSLVPFQGFSQLENMSDLTRTANQFEAQTPMTWRLWHPSVFRRR